MSTSYNNKTAPEKKHKQFHYVAYFIIWFYRALIKLFQQNDYII